MERLSTEALEALGSEVCRRRRAAQLSVEGLAALAGLSRSYMSKVELGLAEFSISAFCSIAKALNCELADLFPSKQGKKLPDLYAAVHLLSDADPEVRKARIDTLQRIWRSTGDAGL